MGLVRVIMLVITSSEEILLQGKTAGFFLSAHQRSPCVILFFFISAMKNGPQPVSTPY